MRRRVRRHALALSAAVVLAGCAGGTPLESSGSAAAYREQVTTRADLDTDTPVGESADDSERPSESAGRTATSARSKFEVEPVEEIPWLIQQPSVGGSSGSASTSSSASASTSTSTSTTVQGSANAATPSPEAVSPTGRAATVVTTVPGATAAVASLYKGYLGTLSRTQRIVDPLGPPPSAVAGTQPLTGLVGAVPNRPAAIVKIDNSPSARPQSGLNAADIVIEEEVEGGVTRFAAVFHSTSSTVGPVRSARTTDIGIINSFGSPLLMYSGANEVTEGLIRAQPTVQNRNAGTSSGYWRSSGRRAPSNLYTDTADHWASASAGPPAPQFSYRARGAGVDPGHPTAVAADRLSVGYRASPAGWSWNGSAWLRSQGGTAHLTSSGEQVSAANVVVIEAREVRTGMVDSTGSNVPEFVFVGAGDVTVFTDGKRIEGRWNRPSLAVAPTLMSGGSVITLTPGRTWIELVGEGKGLLR